MSEQIRFDDENVVYIDEFRREQWLLKLRIARESGRVATFGAIRDTDAQIIEFPKQPEPPEPAA